MQFMSLKTLPIKRYAENTGDVEHTCLRLRAKPLGIFYYTFNTSLCVNSEGTWNNKLYPSSVRA